MKIFDVVNTAGSGFWCIAEDVQDALEIAASNNHIKKPFSERIRVADQTEHMIKNPDLQHFVEQGWRGWLFQEIKALTGLDFVDAIRKEIQTGVVAPPLPPRWLIRTVEGDLRDAYGHTGATGKDLPPLDAVHG